MALPTRDDPLGQRKDPASLYDAMEAMLDARIDQRLRGLTNARFHDVSDMALVAEILARGWAVFRPQSQDKS